MTIRRIVGLVDEALTPSIIAAFFEAESGVPVLIRDQIPEEPEPPRSQSKTAETVTTVT